MKWFRKWQESRRQNRIRKFILMGLKENMSYQTIIVYDGVCEDCPGPDWCECDQGIDCD